MASKVKSKKIVKEGNPSTALLDLDNLPLVDSPFKVTYYEFKFDFHEFHLWLKQKYAAKEDPIDFWETLLPL